jgi:hypothetical protein
VWAVRAKKGERYSITLAYTGAPVQSGDVTLTGVLMHVRPSGSKLIRGLFLCNGPTCPTGGAVEALVSGSPLAAVPVPVGTRLTGRFPATGRYAIGVTGAPDSLATAVPYRLDVRIRAKF